MMASAKGTRPIIIGPILLCDCVRTFQKKPEIVKNNDVIERTVTARSAQVKCATKLDLIIGKISLVLRTQPADKFR
jgi:hypothetical protein